MSELRREILLSVEDARFIRERRKARRRHWRHARLYPSLFLAAGLIFIVIHCLWHPY